MAASAEPEFMMPLAVPEWSGAMSMGVARIGPMVISENNLDIFHNQSERPIRDGTRREALPVARLLEQLIDCLNQVSDVCANDIHAQRADAKSIAASL